MTLTDTHSHLNFKAYDADREEVIKRAQKEGVICINAGTKYETSKKAIELAENNEGLFASVGMHPIHIKTDLLKIKMDDEEGAFMPLGEDFDKKRYTDLVLDANKKSEGSNRLQQKKVVAIGEIGLDYYYKPKTKARLEEFKEKQKQIFLQQTDMARELDLPLIIHCRMAHDEMIKILGSQIAVSYQKLRGVIHCFTGSVEQMEQYLNLGFYIGINGIIYKLDLEEVIKRCPLEKILLETDCPYLTPAGAGVGRNEPIFVKHIAETVAKIKNISYERVSEITTQNARKLFNI